MYRHLSTQNREIEYAHIEQIRKIYPELTIKEKHFYFDGFANDIIIINDRTVFRFPKYHWALEEMFHEASCLKVAQLHTSMRLPAWNNHHDSFISYQKIPGEAMHRWHLFKEDSQVIGKAAADLGTFLHELHHIPVKECTAADIHASISSHTYEDWLKLYDDVKLELFPSMTSSVQDWVETLFRTIISDNTMMDYTPRLITGELQSNQIIFDYERHAISGIVDFRTAGLGDPAFDIAYILNQYGEAFTEMVLDTYKGSKRLVQRARFIAETFALGWALGGMRTGNPYWYLMHMGNQPGYRSSYIREGL